MKPTPILELKDVSVAYGPTKVLHAVNLHVMPGEIVTLIGSNGAGKTTLLKSLYSAPAPYSGSIFLNDFDITSIPTHEVSKRGMSLVPEGRRIFPAMSVVENLAMGLVACADKSHEQATLKKIYELFPRLYERREQRAGTLSGGEQQMLAIGRSMMAKPRLLLLDEPSLGLAPLIVKAIFTTLKQIAADGTTIFIVEQNANQALKLADRAYVLANGVITLTGSGAELLSHDEVRKAYLGAH
ncbi:MAG: ABC transporter ATP-binding protein [Chitinophagaceae bacterium]|nr:ABC transporter ATP-binding protein [Oligoflexus sp.]